MKAKLISIGNAKGIRIPMAILRQWKIGNGNKAIKEMLVDCISEPTF